MVDALKLNRRGLNPTFLRHELKAEDSNDESTDDEEFGDTMDLLDGDEANPAAEVSDDEDPVKKEKKSKQHRGIVDDIL